MANTVYKFQRTGNGFKERLIIKGFKYSDDKYKFLAMADNALFWRKKQPMKKQDFCREHMFVRWWKMAQR